MKLVFPGGEHPQVLLGHGVNRVGSDPGANIVIDRPGVRPQHCQLHFTGHGVMLSADPGSAVQVNGRVVDGLISLRPGDVVAFDSVQARLAALDTAQTPSAVLVGTPTAANDDPGATAVRTVLPRFTLRRLDGGAAGPAIPLAGPVTVGRSEDCELQLTDSGMSRRHARLIPTGDGVQLEDLGSTNGSHVNGKRVIRALVRSGDEVAFDDVRFRLVATGAPVAPEAAPGGAVDGGRRWGLRGIVVVAVLLALAAVIAGVMLP